MLESNYYHQSVDFKNDSGSTKVDLLVGYRKAFAEVVGGAKGGDKPFLTLMKHLPTFIHTLEMKLQSVIGQS